MSDLRSQVDIKKLRDTAQWFDPYDPVWNEDDVDAVLMLIEVAEAAYNVSRPLERIGMSYADRLRLEQALSRFNFGET